MTKRNFAEALKNENDNRKTLTENGAVAYETSGMALLDFNFKLSQYRNMTMGEIQHDFSAVYFEDPMIATKFIFYVGDVRGGLGERKVFRACFDWLCENKPEVANALLMFIPEYTRWDNLVRLVENPKFRNRVLDIITAQLSEDIARKESGKSISLLAKWMPSANASSKETKFRAKNIIRGLEISEKEYRKVLSDLRAYLKVVEVDASANRWDKINYESVPSQANLKYANAFMKHDEKRRYEYLESLKSGTAKINASVTQPHEVVMKYRNDDWWIIKPGDYDEALEQIWKAIPNIMIEDTIVVRDGSGSMTSTFGQGRLSCLDVATALAIYCSEHNSNDWKDKFITFSSKPKFVDLKKCKSLRDKLVRCLNENDCSNTDIYKVMKLILNTAINSKLEMPKNILIISDMQFDDHYSYSYYDRDDSPFGWNSTLFENISKEYEENGYELPKIIFWNVCDRNHSTIPMQDNKNGLVLCSGFSINNMQMFMTGEINPYKVLVDQINTERYEPIEKAINKVI